MVRFSNISTFVFISKQYKLWFCRIFNNEYYFSNCFVLFNITFVRFIYIILPAVLLVYLYCFCNNPFSDCITQFVYPPVDGHFNYFQFFLFSNNAVTTSWPCLLFHTWKSFSVETKLWVLGNMHLHLYQVLPIHNSFPAWGESPFSTRPF